MKLTFLSSIKTKIVSPETGIAASILALPLLLAFLHSRFHQSYTVDDCYISYRYAWNWAHGFGPVFNVGEYVEGYSNFLYTALLALGHLVGFDLESLGIAIGIISFFALILVASHFAKTRAGTYPQITMFGVGFVLAASTPIALWSRGGLETVFFALLLFSATASYLDYVKLGRGLAPHMLLFGLVALTRPEGFAYTLPIIGLELLRNLLMAKTGLSKAIVIMLKQIGVFLVIFAPFLAFRFAYYGEWLPNTVAAKDSWQQQLFSTTISNWPHLFWVNEGTKKILTFFSKHFHVLTLVFVLGPLFLARARHFEFLAWTSSVLVSLLVIIWGQGDWMEHFRLFVPLIAPVVIMAFLGFGDALSWLSHRERISKLPGMALKTGKMVLFCGFVLFMAANTFYEHKPFDNRGKRHEEMIELGRQLQSVARADDLLAMGFIGRIPYMATNLRVLDTLGLTDKRIAQRKGTGDIYGKESLVLVLKENPTLWVSKTPQERQSFLRLPDFKNRYLEIRRPTVDKDNLAVFVAKNRPDIEALAQALSGEIRNIP